MRLGVHQIELPPGTTDGQMLAYDEATDKLVVVDPPAGGGGGGGGVLLLEPSGTVPGGTPVGTVVFRKATAATIYDFTQGALPAGWAKHGSPTETFSGTGMAATFAGAGRGYQIDVVPSNSEFAVEMKMLANGNTGSMVGPTITTAAGTGGGATWYNAPTGCLAIALGSWSYASSFSNGGGTPAVPCRLRVRKTGTSYYAAYSFDEGSTWVESGAISVNGTVTTVGINCAFSSGSATISEVKVTTSTNSGRAIGWWDGSVLQPLA